MAFDGLFMRMMIAELRTKLLGERIEKINQPQRGTFILSFRKSDLLISVEPSAAYISLTDKKLPNPADPPNFCKILRKHLHGAVLNEIRQEATDRTAYFVFGAKNSALENTVRTLVVEAMGRHANMLLLDEQNIIIDCIKRASLDSRQALPGLPYEPFADDRSDFSEYFLYHTANNLQIQAADKNNENFFEKSSSGTDFSEEINFLKKYQGFSKASALFANTFSDRAKEIFPDISSGYRGPGYTCADADGTLLDFYFHRGVLELAYKGMQITEHKNLSEAAEAFYFRSMRAVQLKKLSLDLKNTLSSRLSRLRSKISKMSDELENAEKSEKYKNIGDILLANSHAIPDGAAEIELLGFDGSPLKIKLDTRLSPTENASKYYQKYKKAISATEHIAEQTKITESDISFIEHALVMLDNAESETDIAALRAELEEAGFITKKESKADRVKKVKKPHTLNVHRYNLGSGKELLIGRSNSANDELTMKYASNSDMWLHTNTIPGSHCIIRCAGAEPTEADIKEAAEAAAYYSKARNSSKVAVDYCKVKNVRKPAGARPGMVIYDNYKTAIVEPGIASLTRIKL